MQTRPILKTVSPAVTGAHSAMDLATLPAHGAKSIAITLPITKSGTWIPASRIALLVITKYWLVYNARSVMIHAFYATRLHWTAKSAKTSQASTITTIATSASSTAPTATGAIDRTIRASPASPNAPLA